jgi:hypothetical protein
MTNSIHAIINSQEAIKYSLLLFLYFEELVLGTIDVNAPISQFGENGLVLAVSFFWDSLWNRLGDYF